MGTDHKGYVHITNNWGIDITEITLRHRRGNEPGLEESTVIRGFPQGRKIQNALEITYTTGLGSPYDYWWVKFVAVGGGEYTCKDNFYCSISSSDDGHVDIWLNGDNQTMSVAFSGGDRCSVKLSKS